MKEEPSRKSFKFLPDERSQERVSRSGIVRSLNYPAYQVQGFREKKKLIGVCVFYIKTFKSSRLLSFRFDKQDTYSSFPGSTFKIWMADSPSMNE